MARAAAEAGGGAKKTLAGAVQMFRELSHSTVALIAGKNEDADEDPEYLKVRPGSACAASFGRPAALRHTCCLQRLHVRSPSQVCCAAAPAHAAHSDAV